MVKESYTDSDFFTIAYRKNKYFSISKFSIFVGIIHVGVKVLMVRGRFWMFWAKLQIVVR
jgi:hypothetical protein